MILSFSRNLPSSKSFISEDVVATTLVSEAQSKIVSSGHGLGPRHQRALAVRLAVDHLAVVPHQHHGAGQTALLDGLVDRLVERGGPGKSLCGKSGGRERGAPEKLHIFYDTVPLDPSRDRQGA